MIDANHLRLGTLAGVSAAFAQVGGEVFWVGVDRTGLYAMNMTFVHFTADCSDAPYTEVVLAPWFVPVVSTVVNGTAWIPNRSAAGVSVPGGATVFTRLLRGTFQPCTATTWPATSTVYPFKTVDMSAFVPPFTVE